MSLSSKRPGDKELATLFLLFLTEVAFSTDQLASGGLVAQTWAERIAFSLEDIHAQAASLGRRRGGNPLTANEGVTLEDRNLAAQQMSGDALGHGELYFLTRFAADIQAGRYTDDESGALDVEAIKKRLRLYGQGLAETANRALVAESGGGWTWVLGASKETCADCQALADGSPYPDGSLPTYPGAGDTECSIGCNCEIVNEDGLAGFKPIQ